MESWMLPFLGGVLGLVLGSFLNVCSLRWPQDRSVVSPASCCPRCGRPIRWYENVPVLGWVALGGRCRGCREPISVQYPLVELATGLIWAGMLWQHGVEWEALRGALFLTILLGIAVSDARFYIIPDQFSLGGAALGLLLAVAPGGLTPGRSLAGALLGFGGFWLVGWASTKYLNWRSPDRIQRAFREHDDSRADEAIRARVAALHRPAVRIAMVLTALGAGAVVTGTQGPVAGAAVAAGLVSAVALLLTWGESFDDPTFGGAGGEGEPEEEAAPSALGGGDIKMMALIGAFLGPVGVGLSVFLGSVLAVASWLPLSLVFRQLIPFGIYLAYGAGITWAAGDAIIRWYLAFVGLG